MRNNVCWTDRMGDREDRNRDELVIYREQKLEAVALH